MSAPRLDYTQREYLNAGQPQSLAITDGEINFLWSFIQGSIMIPETWNRLLHGYGFCERHAWTHISIEMSFRDPYLLGPTILYHSLIEKSLHAVCVPRCISMHSVARQLRATDACLLCALNIKDASPGASPEARLDRGRDSDRLRTFASDLESLWTSYVCTACRGQDSDRNVSNRCRRHLLADVKARKTVDLSSQKDLLQELYDRVTRYQNSFLVDGPKANDRDRAAFITAIGWCSGWRPLLALLQ
jgi:hypothetical protein